MEQENQISNVRIENSSEKAITKEGNTKDNAQDDLVLLKFFAKKGYLLDKELLAFFTKLGNNDLAEELLNRILILSKTRIFSKLSISKHFHELGTLLIDIEKNEKELLESFFKIEGLVKKEEIIVKEPESSRERNFIPFKILSTNIIPYKKIEIKDFVTHFKNRYNVLRDILKSKKELNNLVSIDKIGSNMSISIIGMVANKRVTKNKNVFLELEDPTGKVNAIISQNKEEVFEKSKEIMLDDVIALKCSAGNDMLFVNDIFFPEARIEEKKRIDKDEYAIFTSDIHLGSSNFLSKNFARFIEWLSSEDEQAKKVKYLFFVGDNVDGVGVVPGQEERLNIKDIKEQYIKLAEYLEKIPKNITMFMCPGQHDAVRVPEPQPPINKEFAEPLTKIENLFLVPNPTYVEIGCSEKSAGLKVLMYHGASMHGWINEIEELRLGNTNLNPSKCIKYLLRHRHLSPTHSFTTYVPGEKEDSMVIKEVPDIIATGDMHRCDVDEYNNILIICSSCWQSITPFEEKVGNSPNPGKVPILNLKTREMKILDFGSS